MNNKIILPGLFLIIFSLWLPACHSSGDRVAEAKLVEKAIEEGNMISSETQQLLGKTLKTTIRQRGIPAALNYCNLHAYPLVDSIEQKYGVTIKRASLNTRNPQDSPDMEEQNIIAHYQKDLQEGRTPEVEVNVHSNEILFAKPILMNDPVCLNCHGRIGAEITKENYEVIHALYPDDQAAGHKLGDLRGIWSIRFNRENLEKEAKASDD
jgi:hypothetical protein